MDPLLLIALVVALLACGAAVFSLWAGRRKPVNPDQMDVDELAREVFRLAKQVRRDRMSAVRASTGSTEGPEVGPPPELVTPPPSPSPGSVTKDELRRMALHRTRQ